MTPLELGSGAVITALTTAVVALWGLLLKRQREVDKKTEQSFKELKAENASLRKRVDECEEDRLNLWKHVGKLEREIAELRGSPVGHD